MKKLILTTVLLVVGFMVYKSTIAKSPTTKPEVSAGPMDLATGDYLIKSTIGSKLYLDLDGSSNGEKCRMNGLGESSKDNKWMIRKVNGPLGGYTIQNARFGTYLDADYNNTDKNGCKVQGWERGRVDLRNQEWYIKEFLVGSKKMFQFTNVKSSNMALDAAEGISDSEVVLNRVVSNNKAANSQLFTVEKQ